MKHLEKVRFLQKLQKELFTAVTITSVSLCCKKVNRVQAFLQNVNAQGSKANPAGENSSIIFTNCFKTVSFYHFKLVWVILHMSVKNIFEIRC